MGGNCKTNSVIMVGPCQRKETIRTGLMFTLKGNMSFFQPQNLDLVRRQISAKGTILLALVTNGLSIKRTLVEMLSLRARLRASWLEAGGGRG